MTDTNKKHPDCYGDLDIVFPEEEDGIRSSSVKCFDCYFKTECLRTAMAGSEGLKAREKIIDRAFDSGLIGFFQRWSQKKEISRQIENQKRKRS